MIRYVLRLPRDVRMRAYMSSGFDIYIYCSYLCLGFWGDKRSRLLQSLGCYARGPVGALGGDVDTCVLVVVYCLSYELHCHYRFLSQGRAIGLPAAR